MCKQSTKSLEIGWCFYRRSTQAIRSRPVMCRQKSTNLEQAGDVKADYQSTGNR